MIPSQAQVVFAILVAIVAPVIAGLMGVGRRPLVAIGVVGAGLLWIMLTINSPSDREATRGSYAWLWAGAMLVWLVLWFIAAAVGGRSRRYLVQRTRLLHEKVRP